MATVAEPPGSETRSQTLTPTAASFAYSFVPTAALHPPRNSPTFSYGPSNSDPRSDTCINATRSYDLSHSRPERTRKSNCSPLTACRGGFVPASATKSPDLDLSNQLHIHVHPGGIAKGVSDPRPFRAAHVSSLTGSYARRLHRSDWELTHQGHETPRDGMSGMISANERDQSTDRQATAYSAERRETVRRGLRILARMIARSHLRRQASRSLPAPRSPAQRDDSD